MVILTFPPPPCLPPPPAAPFVHAWRCVQVLFIQQGVKGLIAEYDPSTGFGASKVKLTNSPSERNFSGTWALFLAFGLVWTSFKLRQARGWFFFNGAETASTSFVFARLTL